MAKSKRELGDIALGLFKNIDEAEQFSSHMDELFYHLDRKYLLHQISDLYEAVKDNLTRGDSEILLYSEEDIEELLNKVEKLLNSEE